MKDIACIIALWLGIGDGYAQSSPEETMDLQRFTDDIIASQDADGDNGDLYENLVQILSSPHDLNKVSVEELRTLHVLTEEQIHSLLSYRESQGNFLDVYELQVIPGFDLSVISNLLPFVKVGDARERVDQSLLRRMFSPGHSYVVTRYERTLEQKKGSLKTQGLPSRFTGSPDKLYFRMRASNPGDFSIGITGEKDAGEKIVFNPESRQWGFDFTSFHLQLQNKGKLKNIIVGDFQTQFGQGLLLGGAFGLGKGGESISTTRKSNLGFLPYTSVNESACQRGAAVTWQLSHLLRISAFYSHAGRDASIANGVDSLTVTSLQATGYHRTPEELEKRKSVIEKHFGTVLHFTRKGFDAGMIVDDLRFNLPINPQPTLYNQHAFGGSRNLNTGIFVNYSVQNISFFTEVAQSHPGGRAALAGLLLSAHRNFDLAIVYRNYMRNFYTFYTNAFSENTRPQNERGLYWGWKYRWSRQYSFSGYMDLFTFPWLSFRQYAPSHGYEWMVRGHYQPTKKVSVLIQLRRESKSRNLPGGEPVYRLGVGQKRNATVHCDYGIGESIRLKSRLQYNKYFLEQQVTQGMALVQDITFSLGRFKLTARHALFDTDHYDNRQYVYEHDASLAYSLPAYSGVGVRNYALIEYKVHKQLTMWLRYARTRLLNTGEIGSGLDVIEGNTKNDVKFQARFRF
jgi:hypothetical protein